MECGSVFPVTVFLSGMFIAKSKEFEMKLQLRSTNNHFRI